MPWQPYGITQYAIVSLKGETMIKFMVDLRTSADAAAVAGIVELREVVAKLRADLDEVTGNRFGKLRTGRFQ